MDDNTLSSMREIINYVKPDEKRHYEECEATDSMSKSVENHIYNHILIVDKALKAKGM